MPSLQVLRKWWIGKEGREGREGKEEEGREKEREKRGRERAKEEDRKEGRKDCPPHGPKDGRKHGTKDPRKDGWAPLFSPYGQPIPPAGSRLAAGEGTCWVGRAALSPPQALPITRSQKPLILAWGKCSCKSQPVCGGRSLGQG